MGQILSDEGNQEEAINCLIDALRWDSKNGWALLMMGNIFAKFNNDIPTALKYYDQALVANVNDYISLTNIGYLLLQQKKLEEAKKYFWEAIKINDKYPNTHYSLGLIAAQENDLPSSFYSIIQAIKFSTADNALHNGATKMAFELAKTITNSTNGKKIFREYRHQLAFAGNTEIDIIEDATIPTAAKIEFAENYNRTKHLVKYKPKYLAVEHLIMHELVHLQFVIDARKEDLNQLFISHQQHQLLFAKSIEPTIKELRKLGISDSSIANYSASLFEGMNLQVYNTPIDLFIEDFLYNEFTDLRPYQFLSLYNLVEEGLKAVTDKKAIELSPTDILSKSKIYNLVSAMQLKELYGINFIKEFKATTAELKTATIFYEEFLQYKNDKQAAEEYELVLHWAEDLQLDKNFELVNEVAYRTKRTNIDNLLSSIEKDPYDLASKDLYKQREIDKFQQTQQSIGTNMAVVMFMIDALQFFEQMPKEEIKKIAFEIAMQGTQGYRPDKDDYRINAIPNKTFSGYHILAYYYVSWALAIPTEVEKLGLHYTAEYELATQMKRTN